MRANKESLEWLTKKLLKIVQHGDTPEYRPLYATVVCLSRHQQSRYKKVQLFIADNDKIVNVTREVGLVVERKFSNDNKYLLVTDLDLLRFDLSAKIFGCNGSDRKITLNIL